MSEGSAWRWAISTIQFLGYFGLTLIGGKALDGVWGGVADGLAYWLAVLSYLGFRRAWKMRGEP